MPLTEYEQAALDAEPFVKAEDTAAVAVQLAHREIVRLRAQPQLCESEVKSLKMLYEVVERAKERELKELLLRKKHGLDKT